MLSAVCCLLFIQALLLIPSNDVQKGNNIEHMFTILLNNSQSNEELKQLNLIFWWWSPNDLVSWENKMRKRLSFAAVLKLPFNFIYNNKLILETRFKSLHRTLRLSISQIRSWTFGGCEMPFSILSPRILRYFLNFSEGHSVNSRWSGRLHPQVFE